VQTTRSVSNTPSVRCQQPTHMYVNPLNATKFPALHAHKHTMAQVSAQQRCTANYWGMELTNSGGW